MLVHLTGMFWNLLHARHWVYNGEQNRHNPCLQWASEPAKETLWVNIQPNAVCWDLSLCAEIQPLVVPVREKEWGDHWYWKSRECAIPWTLEGEEQEVGEDLVRGRTFQLEVKCPWGGKELGNLWELKEEPWRKEGGSVTVLQRKRTNRIYMEREEGIIRNWFMWLWRQSLTDGWKPRKAGGAIPVQAWRPESQRSQRRKFPAKGKIVVPVQQSGRKWEFSYRPRAPFFLFYPCLQLNRRGPPISGRAIYCTQPTDSNTQDHV